VTNSIDGLNHKTTFAYDALNRKTQTIDARGGITTLLYDAVGNNTLVVDPVANRTTMAYHALNRLTQQIDPPGDAGPMAYDAIRRETSATDRNGRRRAWSYDNDNRVLTETWFDTNGITVNTLTFTYDANGNQLTAANNAGAYAMAYDQLNRVTVTQEPFGVTLTATYDHASRRTLLKDSFSGVITSTYDSVGNLTNRKFSDSSGTVIGAAMTYTARNELASIGRTSPSVAGSAAYTYDPTGRLTHLQQLGRFNTN